MRTLLKEGFLVKKGHVRTNWRTRWFELYDDLLMYYKKKGDKVAAGAVPLKGSSVICPCPMYQKKKAVFQLSSRVNQELLMQASSDEERNEWAQAIGDAIKAYDRLSGLYGDHAGVDLNDLISAMQDKDAGMKLKDLSVNDMLYTNCFNGHDLVEWLIEWSFADDSKVAASIATSLVAEAHLQPLAKCRSLEECRKVFLNNKDALYKYSSYRGSDAKSTFDSSSDSDLSSDSESDVDKKEKDTPSRTTSAKIVKQGFLIKRGHVRRTWKHRLFVLHDNPPMLQYYKGSKVKGEKPLGEVPIRWCTVNTVEQSTDKEVTVKNKERQNLFSVSTEKGKMYVFQAATPGEREDWMRAIMSPSDVSKN